MEDPIKVWELSKDRTGLPVNLCVIDINEDYQDDDYKVSVDDYPSRLIMQNYYDDSDNKEFVHISIDKDNPHLFEDELKGAFKKSLLGSLGERVLSYSPGPIGPVSLWKKSNFLGERTTKAIYI